MIEVYLFAALTVLGLSAILGFFAWWFFFREEPPEVPERVWLTRAGISASLVLAFIIWAQPLTDQWFGELIILWMLAHWLIVRPAWWLCRKLWPKLVHAYRKVEAATPYKVTIAVQMERKRRDDR